VCLVVTLLPTQGAVALRQAQTWIGWADVDGNGVPEAYGVDWDGDGEIDEWWFDDDQDGVIDRVEVDNTHGDTSRSARGKPGMRVRRTPLAGGGNQIAVDWDGGGRFDEVWWDFTGDGTVEDTDTFETESKVVDNTKSTRFRGVFVGVKNGLRYPEKDVDDIAGRLADHGASWDASDQAKLKGDAATPHAIKAAIDAAKADSKPGDEFIFYFSGHGGGWNKKKGAMGGGFVDADGDETANSVPESSFGRFSGSGIATPAAGTENYRSYDLDGDGNTDTLVVKDEHGNVWVERKNASPPPEWIVAGRDADGDGDVDGDDGGVDMNGDGDKNDRVGIDDTILVAGRVQISDDTLATWLSGFPESVTIVVILDACHSGSFVNDLQRVKDKNGRPLRPGHLEVVAACAWDEVAVERSISNGVLTQAILDALTPLPPSVTGGHATSLADHLGNRDDRTTTAELAEWAGASAVTYLNRDEDGDGRRNEDGLDCVMGFEGPTHVRTEPSSGAVGESGSHWPNHDPVDDDGDLEFDEDEEPPVTSFFDVYCDPRFGGLGSERSLSWLSGDTAFDLSGMAPGIRVTGDVPLAPGTVSAPGPTVRCAIQEVPASYRPVPLTESGPMEYGSAVYEVLLSRVVQAPGLDEVTAATVPVMSREPTGSAGLPGTRVTIRARDGVPVELCFPAVWMPEMGRWERILEREFDPVARTVEFSPPHFSRFALVYLGPPTPVIDPPPLAPSRILSSADGSQVHVAWSNPTDPDFSATRVLRSALGPAAAPGSAGQTLVYEGTAPSVTESLPVGTYHFTAFARDFGGSWSTGVVTSVSVLATNRAPLARDDSATVSAGETLAVDPPGVLGNDSDPDGDSLVATLAASAAHGSIALSADGGYIYRPHEGFAGMDAFVYLAGDGTTWSAPATVTIEVRALEPTPTITMRTSASKTLTYGQSYTFRGRVVSGTTGLAGVFVDIEASSNGVDFVSARLTTTAPDGSFVAAFRPNRKVWLRAIHPGDGRYAPSMSSVAVVAVKARVGTPAGPTRAIRGRRVTYAGSLAPRHAAGTYPVRIVRQRLVGRTWRSEGYVSARVRDSGSISRYSRTMTFPRTGRWRLRAYHADARHTAAYSPRYLYVNVR
jgi:hypothetical protein